MTAAQLARLEEKLDAAIAALERIQAALDRMDPPPPPQITIVPCAPPSTTPVVPGIAHWPVGPFGQPVPYAGTDIARAPSYGTTWTVAPASGSAPSPTAPVPMPQGKETP